MNYNRLSVLVLILVVVDVSRSSEVHQSVHDNAVLNSDVLNKKLLPDIKHLLKENCDGNRQKFFHLLSSLEVDGYKFVNGKCEWVKVFPACVLMTMIHYLSFFVATSNSFSIPHAFTCLKLMRLTHFDVKSTCSLILHSFLH